MSRTIQERAIDSAPGAALGVVALAVALASGGGAQPAEPPRSPTTEAVPVRRLSPSHEGQATRLVNCETGVVSGDDASGRITRENDGPCTLLFAGRYEKPPTCTVSGGRIAKVTTTDLVLELEGAQLAYRCSP